MCGEFTQVDVRRDLARELVVAARRWRTRLDERLKTLGLSEARWAALYWLWQTPQELSQTALAERAGVESPTLVRTLDLLCDAGLVERRTSPYDRRAKLVGLTPAALPLIEELDAAADELRQEIMSDLTPEEVEVTLRVLRKLRARLDTSESASVSSVAPAINGQAHPPAHARPAVARRSA